MRITDTLNQQLDSMLRLVDSQQSRLSVARTAVSQWSPAEHLDHSAKVCSAIVKRILDEPEPLSRPISFLGRVILLLGRIPRGKGRSPESLRGAQASVEQLQESVAKTRALLGQLTDNHLQRADAIVPHPVFGGLTPRQALRFAEIHTGHHLRIVADILK